MPPSADAVLRAGPALFAGFAVPAAALAMSSLTERLTSEEQAERKEEADRRAAKVTEMVEILVKNEESASLDKGSSKGDVAKDTIAEEDAAKGQDEILEQADDSSPSSPCLPDALEEEEDDDDDQGQITFDDLFLKVGELTAIAPGAPELASGVEWCGKLLLKELLLATRKTKAQKDVKYSNGEKLETLIGQVEALDSLARRAKHAVPKLLRAEVHEAYNSGWWVRRAQKRKDIIKAVKFVLMAKENLPWLVLSGLFSALASTIGTMTLHYRAEVLQALRPTTASGASSFRRATSAMMVVELIAAAARALESQLRARSQVLMSKSLQVRMFAALIAKDMVWWSNQKEQWKLIMEVWELPQRLQAALTVPLTLVSRITTICVQAQLVRQSSSSMLRTMVALHWVRVVVKRAISWMRERLTRRATSGIVRPSQDKFTWPFALQAENIQMYQSFARGPKEALSLSKFLASHTKTNVITESIASVCEPLNSLVAQGGSIAEFASMGQLVQDGSIDLTQAETVMHYATETGIEMESAFNEVKDAQDRLGPLAQAYDYIEIPSKIQLEVGFEPDKRASGHFVFEDVRFKYPGKKTELLKGVSFEVKPGQTVGITGSSGCGKSTCLRLVERFYDITGGRLLLDGRDIREYKPQWLRSQIVAVAQEPKLLPLAIRDNLTFGCERDPTLAEIEEACRAANIWDVLQDQAKFPNGLETKIQTVQNVSGGEKQRICIARAILADPPILLLDEATSTLDEISQAEVQSALNRLMKGRTTLVVAHRLSTIKDSDKIIGMRDGQVVDDGTHEELLQKEGGVWKELWQKQGASPDARSPTTPSSCKTPKVPLPTLQRTTSIHGKFALLRQAVTSLGGDDAERVESALHIISELEKSNVERTSGERELGKASEASELVRTLSAAQGAYETSSSSGSKGQWTKLRALKNMGALGPRAASLRRAD